MIEYWLMLFFVSLGVAVAWIFFQHLARIAIWSPRPKLDSLRYGLITVFLAIEIETVFEAWEAALVGALSFIAFRAIRNDRARLESALRELPVFAKRLAERRYTNQRFKLW